MSVSALLKAFKTDPGRDYDANGDAYSGEYNRQSERFRRENRGASQGVRRQRLSMRMDGQQRNQRERAANPGQRAGRVWVKGFYRALPRGQRIWVRGHWEQR